MSRPGKLARNATSAQPKYSPLPVATCLPPRLAEVVLAAMAEVATTDNETGEEADDGDALGKALWTLSRALQRRDARALLGGGLWLLHHRLLSAATTAVALRPANAASASTSASASALSSAPATTDPVASR